MQFHWKVLAWMVAGVLVGLGLQTAFEAPAWSGAGLTDGPAGVTVASSSGPASRAGLAKGDVVTEVIVRRGSPEQATVRLETPADWTAVLADSANGDTLWVRKAGEPVAVPLTVEMDPSSSRAKWIAPFAFAADIFLSLLKLLIVPLVMSSITTGVAGVGGMGDLRRLGGKTFVYYMSTSLLAILLGQLLVNLIRPGEGAQLGLTPDAAAGDRNENFVEILRRMVPDNIFEAMTSNGAMLQIIFFSLLLGWAITRTPEPHGKRIGDLVDAFFRVMMSMAEAILTLLPYGVFALLVKVVAGTGFGVFKPLLIYMITVALALVLHCCVTLPLVLRFVARISPVAWLKAMAPALMTAFSTSSSSMTLPVSMRTVEERGKVSNRVASFTLPLGATINMDGTALYECIGVIFLAQYYAGQPGGEALTLTAQAMVVLLALLASIGSAGIPSAGLVMMLTILSALGLPLEGAALLLAVDRPLDMLRTVTNVWSDSCGAAVIARSEGELGPAEL
jgi:Na+/H+-dicarboxylate symporter